jgi:DNA-binding transcriptional MerR regulator
VAAVPREHTVGEVARLSGVTVRTLHHYDRIGLLRPTRRTEAGYRLYDRAALARLQQVLVYRDLGLGLAEITQIMNDPDFDRAAALREQRRLLARDSDRIRRMIGAIDDAICAEERGTSMQPEEMFEVFGEFDVAGHGAEAADRWPGEAYDESRRRTSRYGKDQWLQIREEGQEIGERFAEALAAGTPPGHPEAMDLAEHHRLHIDRWFYPCSPDMHRVLGGLYVQDERFAAYWDAFAEGLASFVGNAIAANAARQSA